MSAKFVNDVPQYFAQMAFAERYARAWNKVAADMGIQTVMDCIEFTSPEQGAEFSRRMQKEISEWQ